MREKYCDMKDGCVMCDRLLCDGKEKSMPDDDKDKIIQQLMHDVAKWKNRALEAADRACEECDEYYAGKKNCRECRMEKIKKEA